MKGEKDSVSESAGIRNVTTHSLPKRSLHPKRSAYFSSGTGSNLKRSKENPSTPPPSSERSFNFASSRDSCADSARSFDWGSAFTERAVDAFRACPKFPPLGVRHLCERRCYWRAYEVSTLSTRAPVQSPSLVCFFNLANNVTVLLEFVQATTDVPLDALISVRTCADSCSVLLGFLVDH